MLADTPAAQGFSFTNLLILLVVLAVLWPVVRYLRRAAERHRRETWRRDGLEDEGGYTEDTDPDLRHDT